MNRTISYLIAVIMIFTASALLAQEQKEKKEKKESRNLERIADDTKYRDALRFMKLKKNDRALEEFKEYLEIYIDGRHRHEAFRNIAKIYSDGLEYLKAIKTYRRLYEEFSNSEAGVEAHYRIGICYRKMGYDKKAIELFQSIIAEHSGSNYAYQAKLQLDLIAITNQ